MALTVIDDPGIGSRLGASLKTGLQQLAQQKLEDVQKRYGQAQQAHALSGLNVSPEGSALINAFSGQPEIQKVLLQNLAMLQNKPQAEAGQQVSPQGSPGGLGNLVATQENNPFVSPEQRRRDQELAIKEEGLGIKRRTEERESQEKVMPFVNEQVAAAKDANKGRKILLRMRDNLIKNKAKWPGNYVGTLPAQFFSDKDVRNYARDASQYLDLRSNVLKGPASVYRVKLKGQGKIGLDQPYESQLEGIDNELADMDSIISVPKTIEKIKKENKGLYPQDLALRVYGAEEAHSIPSDLPDPKDFKGKRGIKDRQSGVIYYTPDGKNWKVKKEE